MNPNIAELARHPRGKPYRSRLMPYIKEIFAWHEADVSLRDIAALLLTQHGFKTTHAAVGSFLKVREKNKGCPLCTLITTRANFNSVLEASAVSNAPELVFKEHLPSGEKPARPRPIFIPPPKSNAEFSDSDLAFNDPLDLEQ